jgi:hypothetical protein
MVSVIGTVEIDGEDYEVVHWFSLVRCLVVYEGLYALADEENGEWDLSGEPASSDEAKVITTFTESTNNKTIISVTKEDP